LFLIVNAEPAETASKTVKILEMAMAGMSKGPFVTYPEKHQEKASVHTYFIAHHALAQSLAISTTPQPDVYAIASSYAVSATTSADPRRVQIATMFPSLSQQNIRSHVQGVE
jgi:hypothetical protein